MREDNEGYRHDKDLEVSILRAVRHIESLDDESKRKVVDFLKHIQSNRETCRVIACHVHESDMPVAGFLKTHYPFADNVTRSIFLNTLAKVMTDPVLSNPSLRSILPLKSDMAHTQVSKLVILFS